MSHDDDEVFRGFTRVKGWNSFWARMDKWVNNEAVKLAEENRQLLAWLDEAQIVERSLRKKMARLDSSEGSRDLERLEAIARRTLEILDDLDLDSEELAEKLLGDDVRGELRAALEGLS